MCRHVFPAASSHLNRQSWIIQYQEEPLCQQLMIIRRHDEASLSVADGLGRTARVANDDR